MILVDTGPWVGLFNPRDAAHARSRDALRGQSRKLVTSIPVLTEAFHLLSASSRGARALREFILAGGAEVWFMDSAATERAFELMDRYADLPMDLADASLVTGAERLGTRHVLTIDRDLSVYRVRKGNRNLPFLVESI